MVGFILPGSFWLAHNSFPLSPCRDISRRGLDIKILDFNHSLVVLRRMDDYFSSMRNHAFNAPYFEPYFCRYYHDGSCESKFLSIFRVQDLDGSSEVCFPFKTQLSFFQRTSIFLISLIFFFSLSISILSPSIFHFIQL